MKDKDKAKSKIPLTALLIILGLVLVIFRNAPPEMILRILAAGLLIFGAIGFFLLIRDKEAKTSEKTGKGFVNLICIALGIAILAATGFFTGFVKFILGGVMILFGLKDLIPAIRYKLGILKIILSGIAIVIGIYLIAFPPKSLTLFAGISLIYCGAVSIFGGSKKNEPAKKG